MDDILTVEEVGAYLHVCKKTVYQLAKQGSLPATRVGSNLRFYRSEIDQMLKRMSKNMLHILVIDDAPAVCGVIKEALEGDGHMVLTATKGADGLECLKDIKFDKIFLDLKMPDMDGVEVLQGIRQMDPEVPVVIITGYPDSDMLKKASAFGVSRVMQKPFNISDVRAAVAK